MRVTAVLLMMTIASGAQASGGISCEAEDKHVAFDLGGGVTHGMGGALFSFEGSASIKSAAVAHDLREVVFGRDQVAQYLLNGRQLALVLYREREGDLPHGYVELSVDTLSEGEGSYAGTYRIAVFENVGEGRTYQAEGKVTCFAE
ncbi:hypothetical protein ABGN05_27690 [Aquibium sp. LZ166]|uniref:Uncharacterized protein n=1 Tax=Aquibium pacificus TaxID=3153579 RepID=A0ABV3SRL3_9HYPH